MSIIDAMREAADYFEAATGQPLVAVRVSQQTWQRLRREVAALAGAEMTSHTRRLEIAGLTIEVVDG